MIMTEESSALQLVLWPLTLGMPLRKRTVAVAPTAKHNSVVLCVVYACTILLFNGG